MKRRVAFPKLIVDEIVALHEEAERRGGRAEFRRSQ